MMSGIQSYNSGFLADLSDIEARIAKTNKEISSGTRVNQASDDPAAIASILNYQNGLAGLKQVQTNLDAVQTEAKTADGALQSATSLMDQLVSLGARGASSTADPASLKQYGAQVQQIQQQLMDLANTTVNGRYIFGGDDGGTVPYTLDATTGAPTNLVPPTNTQTIRDSDGNQIVPRLTAKDIFGDALQSAFSLSNALLADPFNQADVTTALDGVKAAVPVLGSASTQYGNIENWITQASNTATTKTSNFTQNLSSLRDSDVANDAMQLTMNKTALEAALSAHANLDTKSLFSYLG